MNPIPNSSERRQFFRCPVIGLRQEGELRFGGRRLKVQLLDESSGGFCALSENPPGIEICATGLLCVGEDWYEVRVTNIELVELARFDEDEDRSLPAKYFLPSTWQGPAMSNESTLKPLPETSPARYRLNLYRMGDTFNPDINPTYYSWAGLSCHLQHVSPGSIGVIFVGIVLAITAVIVPYTAVQLISSDTANANLKAGIKLLNQHKPAASKMMDNHPPNTENTAAKSFTASATKAGTDTPKAADSYSSSEPYSSYQLIKKNGELRKTIQKLPGAMPFVLPDIIQLLELTVWQQDRIRELAKTEAKRINNLGSSSGKDDSRKKLLSEKDIIESTRIKVIELLDDNQKKRWNELTREPENEDMKAVDIKQ